MHKIVLKIIYALWHLAALGLVWLLFLQIKHLYIGVILKICSVYLRNKTRFIKYMYQRSLSKNYNYFIFGLTAILTLVLKEVARIPLYVHQDLMNWSPDSICMFLIGLESYPIRVLIFFLCLGLIIATIVFIFIGCWHILKIIYFPEFFHKTNAVIVKSRRVKMRIIKRRKIKSRNYLMRRKMKKS